jgi:hypothetical protein
MGDMGREDLEKRDCDHNTAASFNETITDGNNDNQLMNDDTDQMTQSATGLTDIEGTATIDLEGTATIDLITKKRVHVIRKAYTKPSAMMILQQPRVQEAITLLGYVSVGPKIFANNDIAGLISASKAIVQNISHKRARDRAGNHMLFSIYFRYPFSIFLNIIAS